MKRIVLILLIFVLHCFPLEAGISKEEALSLFVEGNLAYREGRYEEAVEKYEGIINAGMESGNLYFNLGNSYLKLNKVGKALLNYERAKVLIPRDSDLKANYRLAIVEREGPPLVTRAAFWQRIVYALLDFCSINEIFAFAMFLAVLMGLYHLFSLYCKWPFRISVIFYVVTGFLFSFVLLVFVMSVSLNKNRAVIIADAEAKFEPRKEATAYFDLYQGHRVRIIKKESNWYKIERPDGKKGWIPKTSIEEI